MTPLNQYSATTSNWRKSLRSNSNKTYIVIGLFFLIYSSVGILVDMYLYSTSYPTTTLAQLFHALITFQLFPIATIVMLAIAAVSLWVSYAFYDKLMLLGTEYHEVTGVSASNLAEKQLYNTIEEMKIAAGLHFMPRVFIIEADYMNAFASGYSEKSAMVAITRGLLVKLNRDELQAVMAHELSHIRHLDIKLTLTASLLANLMLMVLDLLFYNALFSGRRDNRTRSGLFTIIFLLRYLLPLINIFLLLYLSRTREFMADAGCVELMRNNQPLATALMKIQQDYTDNQASYRNAIAATPHENVRREAYIFDPQTVGMLGFSSINNIFSTHPSLDARLAAIGYQRKKT